MILARLEVEVTCAPAGPWATLECTAIQNARGARRQYSATNEAEQAPGTAKCGSIHHAVKAELVRFRSWRGLSAAGLKADDFLVSSLSVQAEPGIMDERF